MRITNQIIYNNTLNNLNNNKILEDKLNTQIATGKKISRPSQDPIVALRALRFGTSVNELTQYYDKNIKDAKSFMSITEEALNNLNDIIENCITKITDASNGYLTESDLDVIFTQLDVLSDEFNEIGNTSYAGRYIFTGFRTDTSLTFKEDTNESFKITQSFSNKDVKNRMVVNVNGESPTESDIEKVNVNKIKLFYDDLESAKIKLDGEIVSFEVITDENNIDISQNYFNKKTGELIIGSDFDSLEITYQKDKFNANDVNPIHLFDCENNGITYTVKDQSMKYDVGHNQNITVNTQANKLFNLDLKQSVDILKQKLEQVKLAKENANNNEVYQKKYNYLKEDLMKLCKEHITKFQDIQNKVQIQITDNGSRMNRLDLIENRVGKQLQTFKELKSSNEDIDMAEVVTKLSSAQTAYNASLLASSKILQTSLINYI